MRNLAVTVVLAALLAPADAKTVRLSYRFEPRSSQRVHVEVKATGTIQGVAKKFTTSFDGLADVRPSDAQTGQWAVRFDRLTLEETEGDHVDRSEFTAAGFREVRDGKVVSSVDGKSDPRMEVFRRALLFLHLDATAQTVTSSAEPSVKFPQAVGLLEQVPLCMPALPSVPVKPGASWHGRRALSLSGAAAAAPPMSITYRLEKLEGAVAWITASGKSRLDPGRGMAIDYSLQSSSRIAVEKGRWLSTEMVLQVDGRSNGAPV